MTITSADIAASVEATARDMASAMITYQKALPGTQLRSALLASLDQLHERLCHQLIILTRKHIEER